MRGTSSTRNIPWLLLPTSNDLRTILSEDSADITPFPERHRLRAPISLSIYFFLQKPLTTKDDVPLTVPSFLSSPRFPACAPVLYTAFYSLRNVSQPESTGIDKSVPHCHYRPRHAIKTNSKAAVASRLRVTIGANRPVRPAQTCTDVGMVATSWGSGASGLLGTVSLKRFGLTIFFAEYSTPKHPRGSRI